MKPGYALGGCALLGVVVALCSLPALGGGFIYDDKDVAEHPLFAGVENLLPTFNRTSHDYAKDTMDAASGTLYRPLPVVSFIVTTALFGRVPLPHHLVSSALHLLICALIILLGSDLRARRVPVLALLVGLVYGLHPLTSEVQQWINGRCDLLSGCALTALALMLRNGRARALPPSSGLGLFVASSTALLIGALCKEPFLVAAAFLLLSELVPDESTLGSAWTARARALAPALCAWLFAFATSSLLRSHAASSTPHTRGAGSIVTDPGFLLRIPRALALGVEALLVPMARPMRALSWEFAQPWTALQTAALVLAAVCTIWALRRKQWRIAILLAGAAATMAPTALVGEFFWLGLDRYVYLPFLLLIIALAPSLPALQARLDAATARRRGAFAALAGVLALWLSYSSWTASLQYRSELEFARALIVNRPEDPSGYLVGANAVVEAGGRAEVLAYLQSLSDRDLPPAFTHAAARAQAAFGLYRAVERTLDRALVRFPHDALVRYDVLELRGAQRRFDEGLELGEQLLRDARLCTQAQSKLREWEREPSLPEPVRVRIRTQLAARPCG